MSHEETVLDVWNKFQEFYLQNTLANRLYIRQMLYSYKIQHDRLLGDQLDEFSKVLDDLENANVKLQDEDKAILLLNVLPKSYDQLKDVMLYGRLITITLAELSVHLKQRSCRKCMRRVMVLLEKV